MNPALRSLLRAWLPLNLLNLLGVLVAMMFGPWVLVNLLGFSDASFGSLNLMRTFFVSYIGIAFFACNAAAWAPLSDLLRPSRPTPQTPSDPLSDLPRPHKPPPQTLPAST